MKLREMELAADPWGSSDHGASGTHWIVTAEMALFLRRLLQVSLSYFRLFLVGLLFLDLFLFGLLLVSLFLLRLLTGLFLWAFFLRLVLDLLPRSTVAVHE